MSDNWVVSTLEDALSNWNDKLAEIWSLVSQTPESFRGGEIWTVIVSIHNALVGFGYGLLVLFFAMGVFRSAASFRELQRPEFALRHFSRFLLAKVAVGSSLELITAIYKICGGVVSTVMGGIGSAISTTATLPDKIVEAIEDVSFLESIPLWLVSLLGSLLITVLSFVLILTVYGRFFKIFIYTAIAPLPLASFAGEATSRTGQTFLKSYVGVCMEGAVIVLSCVIYSAFLSGGSTALDESLPAVTMVWQYIGQLMFNMLVLTGLVKGSNRLVHEMLGALKNCVPTWGAILYIRSQKFKRSGFAWLQVLCIAMKKLCHDLFLPFLSDEAHDPVQKEEQHTADKAQNTSGSVRKRPARPEQLCSYKVAAKWKQAQFPEDTNDNRQTEDHKGND